MHWSVPLVLSVLVPPMRPPPLIVLAHPSDQPAGTPRSCMVPPRNQKGCDTPRDRVGAADRLTVGGGGEGDRVRASERSEATHRGAVPQEGATLARPVQCRTHHLTALVDAVSPARVAAERGQRIHRTGLEIESVGMVEMEVAGRAHDLAVLVDACRGALGAAGARNIGVGTGKQRADGRPRAARVREGVGEASPLIGDDRRLPGTVDPGREALESARRSDDFHLVALRRTCRRCTDDAAQAHDHGGRHDADPPARTATDAHRSPFG